MNSTPSRINSYCNFLDTFGGRVKMFPSSAEHSDKAWLKLETTLPVTLADNASNVYILSKNRVIAATPKEFKALGMKNEPFMKAAAASHLDKEQARHLRDALNVFLEE
jgi:hypothetical protein